jgi:metal-responsive CopG/Arc/MetJ family transcriptional regulator
LCVSVICEDCSGVPTSRSLVERIDDFRFERRLSSRAEAIRELIEAGLQRAKETNRRNFS